MEIELRFFATVREAVGERTVVWEFDPEAAVGDVLATVESRFPELDGRLLDADEGIAKTITVMRNGTNVTHHEGAETELTAGDSLSVTPPVTGGKTVRRPVAVALIAPFGLRVRKRKRSRQILRRWSVSELVGEYSVRIDRDGTGGCRLTVPPGSSPPTYLTFGDPERPWK